MFLSGRVERAFGTFISFRGFAPFGELADASVADENFQRDAINYHVEDIRDFLNDKQGLFFPEVILGTTWAALGLEEKGHEIDRLLNGREQKQIRRYKEMDIRLTLGKPIVKEWTDRAFSMTLLKRLQEQKPFRRIDGNHRLMAVPSADDDPSGIRQRRIPFCIVVFPDQIVYQRNAALIFHNINYRALPISEEKNLELVLESKNPGTDEYLFTGPYLQENRSFGWAFYFARRLIEDGELKDLAFLGSVIDKDRRTFLVRMISLLLERKTIGKDEHSVSRIKRWLIKMDMLLEQRQLLSLSLGVAIAVAYFVAKGPDAELFVRWVSENALGDVGEIDPRALISVFEKTHQRGPYKVFVAMPYISNPHVNDFNKLFKEVLSELSDPKGNSDGIKYELIPIMRFRGAAQRIDRRLIEKIKECDIFIADITGNNENVIFEVGLAEGNGKQMLLIRSNDDSKPDKVFVENEGYVKSGGRVPFDMDKLQYIPYSATGYYNGIKSIVRNHLPEIAKKLG